MVSMHRDKCGAAFVAGFFKTLSILKPKGLKVYGSLCFTRNSIGEGIQTTYLQVSLSYGRIKELNLKSAM
jgi:hypothetical protein